MPDTLVLIAAFVLYTLVVIGGITAFLLYDRKQKKRTQEAAQVVGNLQKELNATKTELMYLQQTHKSQNLYGAAVHGLDAGIVIVDKNGAILLINPAVESFLGISSLDIKEQHYRNVFTFATEKGEEIPAPFEKALLGETPEIAQWTFLKTASGNTPIDASVVPIKTAGEIVGALFVFRDATLEFQKERMAKDSNDALVRERDAMRKEFEAVKSLTDLSRNVVSSMSHGLIILDSTGHIAYQNSYAERFTGTYQNEAVAKPYRDILYFTDKDGKPKDEPIETALTGNTKPFEKWTFLNSHASGRTPISGSATPLKKDGIITGVVIDFADAAGDFQEAEDEKAFFSASAHDLRSPLSAIRSMVELLVDSIDTAPKEKAKELATNMNEAVLQLIALVNDLLNISRIEQGRIVVAKEPLDIVGITADVVTTQEVIARGKKLYLTHQLPDEKLPSVLGDKNKVRDVVTNLIANAIKYTHQDGVTISHAVEGLRIITRIRDTGVGITPENLRLLFRKFQQVGTARGQSVAKSTGLGLYIAKKFAQLMEGDVVCEKSEPGRGSTFSFSLPAAASEPAPHQEIS